MGKRSQRTVIAIFIKPLNGVAIASSDYSWIYLYPPSLQFDLFYEDSVKPIPVVTFDQIINKIYSNLSSS